MENNMKLWESIQETDPEKTKGFSRKGGFKGTSIKPYYLIMRATEVFGPLGMGWGFEEKEHLISGGVWFSKVTLWYVLEGKLGRIEQWGATEFTGKNKNGEFIDEEAAKKSVTDAVTKCLSYLGFGADVHMGLFDDDKYVTELKKKHQDKEDAVLTDKKREAAMGYVTEYIGLLQQCESLPQFYSLKSDKKHEAKLKRLEQAYPDLRESTHLAGQKVKNSLDAKTEGSVPPIRGADYMGA